MPTAARVFGLRLCYTVYSVGRSNISVNLLRVVLEETLQEGQRTYPRIYVFPSHDESLISSIERLHCNKLTTK